MADINKDMTDIKIAINSFESLIFVEISLMLIFFGFFPNKPFWRTGFKFELTSGYYLGQAESDPDQDSKGWPLRSSSLKKAR